MELVKSIGQRQSADLPRKASSAAAAVCERCDGTGWAPVPDTTPRRVEPCPCRHVPRGAHAPSVPLEFRDAVLETYRETDQNRHALAYARGWLEKSAAPDLLARDLYIFGRVGSGKTRLACSLLNEVYRRTGTGLFARVPMLLLKLQPHDAEQHEEFWRACNAPLLVLDDLGAEREMATDFTRRTLLMLYEERGDHGLKTIWTGNKSLTEVGDFMQDERLASRIKGRADVIELSGADWRVTRRR